MNKLAFMLFLAVMSLPAFSLVELEDDELRDIDGRIVYPGATEDFERELVAKFKEGNQEAFELNRFMIDLQRGVLNINERTINDAMRRFYFGLGGMGIPHHILERNMEYNLYLQQQALEAARTLEQQRALFRAITNSLMNAANIYRQNGNVQQFVVNINNSFGLRF